MPTIGERLRSSFHHAGLAAGISGCVLLAVPRAVRLWEVSLADAAIRACRVEGGVAFVASDRVIRCAPAVLATRGAP